MEIATSYPYQTPSQTQTHTAKKLDVVQVLDKSDGDEFEAEVTRKKSQQQARKSLQNFGKKRNKGAQRLTKKKNLPIAPICILLLCHQLHITL